MQTEVAPTLALSRTPKGFLPENFEATLVERAETGSPYLPTPPAKAGGRASEKLETRPPYTLEMEVNCEECGGLGFDSGGTDPWGPEPCPACQGAKTQTIIRNFLAEAFRMVSNPECLVPVERAHLVAIVQYCREAVSAVVGLPEVPERAQTQAKHKSSSRHSRRKVTQIERKRENVDISSQRARSRKRAAAGG